MIESDGAICLYTPHPKLHLPPPVDYTLQLLPVSPSFFLTPHLFLTGVIHLCSVLSTAKALTYGSHPTAASLALCSQGITMKDRVLIISIHFSPRLAYMFQIKPKIYDINILSLSKCGLMGRTAMRTNRESHDYLY